MNKFNIMINDLKGLKFHVFMVMCRSDSKNAKDIFSQMILKLDAFEELRSGS